MGSGTLHTFVDGSFGIGHGRDENCPCKPVRKSEYKPNDVSRGGAHQGYNIRRIYQHNHLPEKVQA